LKDLTLDQLDSLAADDIPIIPYFCVDGFAEEASPLISKILQKTEHLEISVNSGPIVNILSEISDLPAKRLTLSTNFPLPLIPNFPGLESLHRSIGLLNLISHSNQLKSVKTLEIYNVRVGNLGEDLNALDNLEEIQFVSCSHVHVTLRI
jgi:hypothetical protein